MWRTHTHILRNAAASSIAAWYDEIHVVYLLPGINTNTWCCTLLLRPLTAAAAVLLQLLLLWWWMRRVFIHRFRFSLILRNSASSREREVDGEAEDHSSFTLAFVLGGRFELRQAAGTPYEEAQILSTRYWFCCCRHCSASRRRSSWDTTRCIRYTSSATHPKHPNEAAAAAVLLAFRSNKIGKRDNIIWQQYL